MPSKKTLEDMQELARERGGECTSSKYVNSRTKLKWKCEKGHEWKADGASVQRGTWCPWCSGRIRLDPLDELKKIAKKHGGECLATEYKNIKIKLGWRCAEGHEWEASSNHIRNGVWCPHCAGVARLTLADMHELASQKGGKCLSESYKNRQTKLRWRCAEGHEWSAVPSSIQIGVWCPTCSSGNSERICRDIFEQLLEKPFPKTRPPWLRNDRGQKMELDGFSESLGLAFEYHGRQHYVPVSLFHQGTQTLERRQVDDLKKHALCKEHGITLVDIPYTVPLSEIPEYVFRLIHDRGLSYSMCNPAAVVVAQYIFPERLQKMQSWAKQRNGECLSLHYINSRSKLRWKCAEGHEWDAGPSAIKSGQWCPHCAGRTLQTLDAMHALAKQRNGECVSLQYTNSQTKLRWRCANGHEWEAKPNNITQGAWCPHCAGTAPHALSSMLTLAKERGGECLSTAYVNTKTKLRWKCAEGHEWEAVPSNVLKGAWCPICVGKVPPASALAELRTLATERGGECLSGKYLGSKTHLRWRCAEGHEWETASAQIRQGSWCPYCAGKAPLSLEIMQGLAKKRGGACLSTEYINSKTPLRWKCAHGHEWEAQPTHIKNRGQWCPVCAGRLSATIDDMRQIAQTRGGECLSTAYVNVDAKLRWQCCKGHEWEATPYAVRKGQWCPHCARVAPLNLEVIQQDAKARGGECLSTAYVNTKTKLRWKCAEGHEWEAPASSIRSGQWCPKCAIQQRAKTLREKFKP